jgi:hypothetical protein
MIIGVGIYVALTFIGDELTLLLTCLPVQRRWIPAMDGKRLSVQST